MGPIHVLAWLDLGAVPVSAMAPPPQSGSSAELFRNEQFVIGHYEFQFNFDRTTARDFSRIDYYTDKLILKTYMTGKALPLTNLSALKVILKYPFITLKIIIQIHLNAFILWTKKIPLTLSERNK